MPRREISCVRTRSYHSTAGFDSLSFSLVPSLVLSIYPDEYVVFKMYRGWGDNTVLHSALSCRPVTPSSRALRPACISSYRGALVPLSRSVLPSVPVRTDHYIVWQVIHDSRDHTQKTFRRFPFASLTLSDVLIHTHPTSFDCPDRVPTSQGTFATGSQAAAIFSENN
jgi:hypothetical protein